MLAIQAGGEANLALACTSMSLRDEKELERHQPFLDLATLAIKARDVTPFHGMHEQGQTHPARCAGLAQMQHRMIVDNFLKLASIVIAPRACALSKAQLTPLSLSGSSLLAPAPCLLKCLSTLDAVIEPSAKMPFGGRAVLLSCALQSAGKPRLPPCHQRNLQGLCAQGEHKAMCHATLACSRKELIGLPFHSSGVFTPGAHQCCPSIFDHGAGPATTMTCHVACGQCKVVATQAAAEAGAKDGTFAHGTSLVAAQGS